MGAKNASFDGSFPGFVQKTEASELLDGNILATSEDDPVRDLRGKGEQIILQGILHFAEDEGYLLPDCVLMRQNAS